MDAIIKNAMPKKVPPASAFGERLYKLRKARGLTQIQLAQAIGSTQRAISRYETTAEHPPAAILPLLAKILNVTTDELLGIKKLDLHRQEPNNQRLWKKFQKITALPEKDKRAIIRMINSLVAAQKDAR